jgi:hypothetical protein
LRHALLRFSRGEEKLPSPDFGAKLALALKALSLSRGRLALELKVDKSVVGRWVAGTITPSDHNLAALTSFIATRRSGFTMFDWDRELPRFAEGLGIDPAAVRRDQPAGNAADRIAFPRELIETARHETQRRGKSYEGFYEATFPSTTRPGSFLTEMAIIQSRNDVLHMRMGSAGNENSGWLLLIANQLYGVLFGTSDDSLVFLLLNGLPIKKVDAMDGLFVSNSGDASLAPMAIRIYLEYVDGLREDDAANEVHFSALKAKTRFLEPSEVSSELRAHLIPDVGPAAAATGLGDLLLRLPMARSLSRSTDIRD